MKFIHLTNASPEHKGQHIVINLDHVVSVFPYKYVDPQDGLEYEVTKIFCPPHGTWDVEESTIDVIAKINELTGSR